MSKNTRRLLIGSALLAGAWGVLALLVVPRLIRDAYAGRSLPFVNALIEGREAIPLATYLATWREVVLRLTIAAVLLPLLLFLVRRLLSPLAPPVGRVLRSEPVVHGGEMALLGAWLGFLSGFLEAGVRLIRQAIVGEPGDNPPTTLAHLWMSPLVAALLGAAVGWLLGLLLRARRGIAVGIPVALIGTLAFYSILSSLRAHLSPLAILVLSAGVATQLARWSQRHGDGFRRVVRRTAPLLGALFAVVVAGEWHLNRRRERAALAALGPATPGAPNVLLLILDTVRAPELGLYGYARSTSPELERWAAGGVTFDRAIAPAPWTLPSHAALFTGRLPRELSVDWDRRLDETSPTLAERLGHLGYATGGFVANLAYTSRASGLQRGFTVYRDYPLSFGTLLNSNLWTERLTRALRLRLGMHGQLGRKSAEEVNREFLAWRHAAGRPFFAFLNYFDAHTPYETRAPFEVRFTKRPPRYWRVNEIRGHPRSELRESIDAYDSAIAYLDHQVGALLDELNRRGVLDNTIVIITADHGEQLGEHNLIEHANSLYLPVLHVPLVIRYPRQVPGGRRVADVVELRDVAETILELIDSNPAVPLSGRSLARYWSGDSTRLPGASGVLSELSYNSDHFFTQGSPIHRGSMKSLVRGNFHYIRNGDGVEELYDLGADPEEQKNLASTHPMELGELRRALGALTLPPKTTAGASDGFAGTR